MSAAQSANLLFALLVQDVMLVALACAVLRRIGMDWRDVGLTRPKAAQIAVASAGGVLLAFSAAGITNLELVICRCVLPARAVERLLATTARWDAAHTFTRLPNGWLQGAFIGMAVLIAPFAEEMVFRGMLYHALQRISAGKRLRVGPRAAVAVSALLFAVLHVSPLYLLPLFGMGLLFGTAYRQTGSLWAAVAMHGAANAAAFVLLLSHAI